MSMQNRDEVARKRLELQQQIADAVKSENPDDFAKAFLNLADDIRKSVEAEFEGKVSSLDTSVLIARGVRPLTVEEKSYYGKVLSAMSNDSPATVKAAMAGIEEVMPRTVFDSVFEDLTLNHELLSAIDLQNATAIRESLYNAHERQSAVWGELDSEIVKGILSAFKRLKLDLFKITAFLLTPRFTIDIGPEWLDRYVRAVLAEAFACGIEMAVIDGSGKNEPIGMMRYIPGEGVTVVDGVHPQKDAIAVVDFSPASYGALIADNLATTPNGNPRTVSDLLMVVNPIDYYKLVMPATTMLTPSGGYVRDVLPIPTKIVKSVFVPQGKAVLGLPKRYFMAVGAYANGKIEYSDEYKFLEDVRTYVVRGYGNGQPKDNGSFVVLDISGLVPLTYTITAPLAAGFSAPLTVGEHVDFTPGESDVAVKLVSLSIGSASLSPSFDPSVFNYTATTSNATNTVAVAAASIEGTEITIRLNGEELKTVHSSSASATAAWQTGENHLEVLVECDASAYVYTVTVTRT